MPPRIPVSEAQIDRIVAQFYQRVRAHPTLGPVFAGHVGDWPVHEETIGRFWRNVLLLQRCYDGVQCRFTGPQATSKLNTFPFGCRYSTRCWLKNYPSTSHKHGLRWRTGSVAD